jgi:F-type H+-transporting ATPase subunit epsilon
MSNLNLEIISVTGVVFKGQCNMAVVPSVEGDIGVMFGHESLIAKLREGQITIYDDKQNIVKQIDVKGGFAEMHAAETLSVLVD